MLQRHRSDAFIEFIRDLLYHSFVLNSMKETVTESWGYVEDLVRELHEAQLRNDGSDKLCRLKKLIPSVENFHTRLPLQEAFEEYNDKYCVTSRRFVRPSFNDIRHILNLAQINAIGSTVRLITLDGDCTLYADGKTFEDEKLARYLCFLLKHGVHVALVTAAGYGLNAEKYEGRIGKLLTAFEEYGLSPDDKRRFFVMGGESNYLFQCEVDCRLKPIPEEEWNAGDAKPKLTETQVSEFLDKCHSVLKQAQQDLKLRVRFILKPRAIGMVPGGPEGKQLHPTGSGGKSIRRELLDECVLRVKDALEQCGNKVDYCAFNGGSDVWVDVGDKKIGVACLQQHLGIKACETLHVGDQFSSIGNDLKARSVSATVWIINPKETRYCLKMILKRRGKSTKTFGPDEEVPE